MMSVKLSIIFYIVASTLSSDGAEIYISKFNSHDNEKCGSITAPCASLKFAIEERTSTNDIVRLDGGRTQQLTYVIDERTYIERNVTVTNYGEIYHRPILLVNKFIFEQPLFFMTKKVKYLRISNINFVGVILTYIIYGDNLSIQVNHCRFTDSRQYIIKLSGLVKNVHINISMCHFHRSLIMKLAQHFNGNVTIHRCIVTRGYNNILVHIEGHYNFCIDNCIFSNTRYGLVAISKKGMGSRVFVKNTTFIGTPECNFGIRLNSVAYVGIMNSSFAGFVNSAVQLMFVTTFSIEQASFTENKAKNGGALFIFQSNEGFINNCTFTRNSAKVGGAIYNFAYLSYVFISNTKFISNFADELGGHVCYFGQKISRTVSSPMIFDNVDFIGTPKYKMNYGFFIFSTGAVTFGNVSMVMMQPTYDVEIIEVFVCTMTCYSELYFTNFQLKCAENFQTLSLPTNNSESISALRCHKCVKGDYSLLGQTLNVSTTYPPRSGINITKSDVKCHQCPTGSTCDGRLVSKGNFWGYKTKENTVRFMPCPAKYCCSGTTKKCTSYNTCNKHRDGVLCGKCEKGYRLSYFNSHCVKGGNCTKTLFWFLFALYGMIYTILLAYYKDIVTFLLTVVIKKSERTDYSLTTPLLDGSQSSALTPKEDSETILEQPIGQSNIKRVKSETYKTYITGIKTILFFFYQIQTLLNVGHEDNNTQHGFVSSVKSIISSVMNLDFIAAGVSGLCPSDTLTVIEKESIKLSLIPTVLVCLCFGVLIHRLYRLWKLRSSTVLGNDEKKLPIEKRAMACYIQLMLLSYTGIATFCFKMVNCVDINERKHLYVQGDYICYGWWQYVLISIIAIWVVPFPLSTYISENMLQTKKITLKQFYFCFTFPLAAIAYYIRSKTKTIFPNPMETSEDKSHVLKLFTGPYVERRSGIGAINWEVVILVRRITIAAICICVVNPVSRMLFLFPVIFSFFLHHLYISPFCENVLNRIETASLSFLLFFNVTNLFWSISYLNDIRRVPGMDIMTTTLVWTEDVILTAPLFILVVCLLYVLGKGIKHVLKMWCIKKMD